MKIGDQKVADGLSLKRLEKLTKSLPNVIMSCTVLPNSVTNEVRVPEGYYYTSSSEVLYIDNLHQCCAAVLHNPTTKDTALLHVSFQVTNTKDSVKKLFDDIYTGETLRVHLIGGEFVKKDPISKHNVRKVLDALKGLNINIVSADIRGKTHPSSMAFDPKDGQLYQCQYIEFLHARYFENGRVNPYARKGTSYDFKGERPSDSKYYRLWAKELWRGARLGTCQRKAQSRARYQSYIHSQEKYELEDYQPIFAEELFAEEMQTFQAFGRW